MEDPRQHAVFIVVMGVSGAGKSTLATNIGATLGLPVQDGDHLHPQANVDKMARGEPLNDADRLPWLHVIRNVAVEAIASQLKSAEAENPVAGQKRLGVVISCSALKKAYRDILRGCPVKLGTSTTHGEPQDPVPATTGPVISTCFVFVHGPECELLSRMQTRQGHFMKADMLKSQLATLEDPTNEEDVVRVNLLQTPEEQVAEAVAGLRNFGLAKFLDAGSPRSIALAN